MKYEIFNETVDISAEEADFFHERYLSNYVYMQRVIDEIDGPKAIKLLCLEMLGKNREQVANRLYGIYNKYRREVERENIGLERNK